MEVTYVLEPRDFTQFNKFWWGRRPIKRWMIITVLFVALGISDLPVFVAWHPIMTPIVYPIVVLGLFYVILLPIQTMDLAKATPGALGLSTMAISPAGLVRRSSVAETRMQWHTIIEITEDAKMIYFFQGSRYAYLIPKRAFPTPEDAHDFLTTAKSYWQNPSQPPTLPSAHGETWPPAPQTLK